MPAAGTDATFTSSDFPTNMSLFVSAYCGFANLNCGQRPFAYTPPTGYKALNTYNLTAPTIVDPSKHFDARSGLSAQFTVNDINFEADLIVGKSTSNSEYWIWADAVRGFDKPLKSDTNTGEGSGDAYTSVGSSGYSSDSNWFTNGRTYTTWAWNAGSSTVTNNAGSIQSEVRASTTAGFSIVSYSGNSLNNSTIGHGLTGQTPKLIITKNRSDTYNWITYSEELAATKVLGLDGNWGSFTPSGGYYSNVGSSTYQVVQGSADLTNLNNSGDDYVAYCWSEIPAYSRISSYTGNGEPIHSTFVWCGFKPAFVMTKRYDTSENWEVRDSTRDPNNPNNLALFPHTSGYEDTGVVNFDFLSNGFKLRNSNNSTNANGGTYMFCAFAESPTNYSNAR